MMVASVRADITALRSGKNNPIAAVVLRLVPLHGYGADNQELIGDVPLQRFVLFGIDTRQRRPDDGDRAAALSDGGIVRRSIDPGSQPRYDCEIVGDEVARETPRAGDTVR